MKGNKWFSLIDKISTERTLHLALEKVMKNAGSCGVDGITRGRYQQNSRNRLLNVNEHVKKGTLIRGTLGSADSLQREGERENQTAVICAHFSLYFMLYKPSRKR